MLPHRAQQIGKRGALPPTQLWTWGTGTSGALGHNSGISRSSPTQVGSLTSWAQIAGGGTSTFAIKIDGTLWSWGTSAGGYLGQNDLLSRSSPTQIGALTNWTAIEATNRHFMALKTDGTLWTWGQGSLGRLGHSSVISRSSPTQVGALTNWAAIAAGYLHSVALKTDGTLWTWGNPNYGELGDGNVGRSSPAQVGASTDWAVIRTGYRSRKTIALKTDGTLWTWGWGNSGQLGQNSTTNLSSPAQVGSLNTWAQIAAGATHSMAIKNDGTLWTWGDNTYGQLGLNSNLGTPRSSPTQVGTLTNWAQIAGGYKHAIALKTDGTLWAWGQGTTSGRLGQNDNLSRSSPTQVGTLTSWSKIAGAGHTIAGRLP